VAAAELLRGMNLPQLEFKWFVEAVAIGKGAADVIVTEGFSATSPSRLPRARRGDQRISPGGAVANLAFEARLPVCPGPSRR